jgi:hypothetical protein
MNEISIGDKLNSGIVFHIDKSGANGLIAVTVDRFPNINWNMAMKFTPEYGWRLPTKSELNMMFKLRSVIGRFCEPYYWSSTEDSGNTAWLQDFKTGRQLTNLKENNGNSVRLVREF